MTGDRIERPVRTPFAATRRNEVAVETAIAHLSLPAGIITPRPDVVHVTLMHVDALGEWLYALGGEVHHGASADGAAVWTLYTNTPERSDGSSVAILVHVAVVDGERVLTEFRQAVAS